MKLLNKFSVATIAMLVFSLGLIGLSAPSAVLAAATTPVLGTSSTFSVLAQTAITGTPTSITGDVGMNAFSSNITGVTGAVVTGTIYATDAVPVAPGEAVLPASVQADAANAFNGDIPAQPLTSVQGPVLDGLTLPTGVYDIGAGRLNGGILTLDGPGVYIFRASSDFISSGSINLINGARACDVYWRVQTLATINGTSFAGTILAGTGVHYGAGVTHDGRALAIGGDVTLNVGSTISGPTCATPAQLVVNKVVVNDNGGTKVIANFPLFLDGAPVVSGVSTVTTAGAHVVSETTDPGYTSVIGGDCDAAGNVTLALGQVKTCTITNNDIAVTPPSGTGGGGYNPPVPPLIDVLKVPNPLSLPNGPGPVQYTYTLRNIGTVPVTNVTMVGDTCSPIVRTSGDTDGDNQLDVTETWVHTCTTTLTETHTNIVTATGMANGITATDIASATVVVGQPIVPPLIHVTKVPSPLAVTAGSGVVTYTEEITNPGTVALSNVTLNDDKCTPMTFVSGDTNDNSLLEPSETWRYTCSTNLTVTTTNTATVTGRANGLIATDFAIATVVVSGVTPALPQTGSDHANTTAQRVLFAILALTTLVVAGTFVKKQHSR